MTDNCLEDFYLYKLMEENYILLAYIIEKNLGITTEQAIKSINDFLKTRGN